ncbi:hypothetical protein PENTCL1PPCAC_10551, partial [Pristionchus entomophagus]
KYIISQGREARITNRDTFVMPSTAINLKTLDCVGDGQVSIYTGSGTGEKEQRFFMRSFPCWNAPTFIFSFDNVISVYVDPGMTYTVEFSHGFGSAKYPWIVERNDYIVMMTSGRSDDIQNLKGDTDNRLYLQIGNT